MSGDRQPELSVCVVAYNQARFIGPCLDSILAQRCDVPFEVIVGDDASTDGTAEIVRGYAERHPGLVKAILHPRNQGPTRNYLAVHSAARGRLVAHMDGDDIWYPSKLQRQLETLAAHPDCTVCVHDMDVVSEDGVLLDRSYSPGNARFRTMADLVRRGGYFAHSSKMYRRSAAITTAWPGHEVLDFAFHLEHASKGRIAWLPERLGAYRLGSGLSHAPSYDERIEAFHHQALDYALALGCDARTVERGRRRINMTIALKRFRRGDREGFRRVIRLRGPEYLQASWKHSLLSALRRSDRAIALLIKARTRRPAARAGGALPPRPDP